MNLTASWWLLPLGVMIGAVGTLVGAGGGFLLMPILLFLCPNEDPEKLTAMSLAAVFMNSVSGTIAYWRMGRIAIRSGLLFAAAALPGTFLGLWVNASLPRRTFDAGLGLFLIFGALLLLVKSRPTTQTASSHGFGGPGLGMAISAVVGFLSSLLGIGGGIIHVPALIYLLGYPAHVATATSHFVLAMTSGVAACIHAFAGDLTGSWQATGLIAMGVVVGAQIGARLSTRMKGVWIVRVLAVALLSVGIRVVLKACYLK